MASCTLLATYDPDWKARWERCHAVITASHAERHAQDGAANPELDARCSRELDELHAAYQARFRTVEEYRDHFMALEIEFTRGLDVPLPDFPDGASLPEVDKLLNRFLADAQDARRERHRPQPADPSNLAAFATPTQTGAERLVERFFLPESYEGGAVDCLLIMEATAQQVHACFVSRRDGGSICNNIERLATDLYRNRFEPRGRWQRARAFLGLTTPGRYRPESMVFYDYLPWNLGGTNPCTEDFSSVALTWEEERGFVHPTWQRFPTTSVFVAEAAARRDPRELPVHQHPMLPGDLGRSVVSERIPA